jgi:hypothetical protein
MLEGFCSIDDKGRFIGASNSEIVFGVLLDCDTMRSDWFVGRLDMGKTIDDNV